MFYSGCRVEIFTGGKNRQGAAMAELEAFRADTRDWLEAMAPASLRGRRQGKFDGFWGGRKAEEPDADTRVWLELMLERGWTAPGWPL